MQCETCGAFVALLIFAARAIARAMMLQTAVVLRLMFASLSGLLKTVNHKRSRLMYPKVVELNVPTWVIGPPIDSEPSPESPADILKIWPQRQSIGQLRPDEFNPIIEALATTHCR